MANGSARILLLFIVIFCAVPVSAQEGGFISADEALDALVEGNSVKRRIIEHVRATFPDFMQKLAHPSPTMRNFQVDIIFREKHVKRFEIPSVGDIRRTGTKFVGTILTEPVIMGAFNKGDPIEFEEADVIDWSYTDVSGTPFRIIGLYSRCEYLAYAAGDPADWRRD